MINKWGRRLALKVESFLSECKQERNKITGETMLSQANIAKNGTKRYLIWYSTAASLISKRKSSISRAISR